MFFYYLGMIGTPILLLLLAVSVILPVSGTLRTVLLLLIAAGSLIFGIIAVRECYIHGGKKDEAAVDHRTGNL